MLLRNGSTREPAGMISSVEISSPTFNKTGNFSSAGNSSKFGSRSDVQPFFQFDIAGPVGWQRSNKHIGIENSLIWLFDLWVGDAQRPGITYQDQSLLMGWCLDCHRNPKEHLRRAMKSSIWIGTPLITRTWVIDLSAIRDSRDGRINELLDMPSMTSTGFGSIATTKATPKIPPRISNLCPVCNARIRRSGSSYRNNDLVAAGPAAGDLLKRSRGPLA